MNYSFYFVVACTHKALPLLVVFEGSKVNVPQVAIFDENMAVGKSENLVMLHVYKLETDHATFFLGGILILI